MRPRFLCSMPVRLQMMFVILTIGCFLSLGVFFGQSSISQAEQMRRVLILMQQTGHITQGKIRARQ